MPHTPHGATHHAKSPRTMSLTKRSPHFDALMEEARRYDELSHERYRESLYLESTKPAPSGAQNQANERPEDERPTGQR